MSSAAMQMAKMPKMARMTPGAAMMMSDQPADTAAQKMSNGGKVKGKGTGTSDSVRTMLSKGEFVMPADSVRKIGVKVLMALKDATHKPTGKTSRGPVRRMADGGLVEDPRKPNSGVTGSWDAPDPQPGALSRMASTVAPGVAATVTGAAEDASSQFKAGNYAQGVGQAVRGLATLPVAAMDDTIGRAADAVKTLATPVVQAGYTAATGDNTSISSPSTVAPRGPAPTSAPAPGTAGAGRGTINPPVASLTGSARPDLANVPSLGGSTGTAVDGAPGVRKFTTADGRTLYSNVAGADNDKLMSSNPGVQVVPAYGGSQAAQTMATAPAAPYAQPGAMTATPGLSIGTGATLFDANKADASSPSLSTISTGGVSRRALAQMANARAIAAEQSATSRANAQTSAAAQIGSSQIGAAAPGLQAQTAAQRLQTETPEIEARTQQTQQAVALQKRLAGLQQQYAASLADPNADPAVRRRLYEGMVAMGGHVRSLAERFTPVSQGSTVDDMGRVIQQPHLLFDNQTGTWVTSPSGSPAAKMMSGPSAQPMPASKDKLQTGGVYQTPRGVAKWDGQKFVAQ